MNNKKVFWTLINILLAVLIIVAFSATTLMLREANSTIASRTISIQGTGSIDIVPDIAQFSFSAIAQAATAELAEQEATKKLNQTIEFLKKSGVNEKDIQTTGFNVYPRYDYNRPLPLNADYDGPTIVGYDANHSVSVKIRDLEVAGEIVGGVARNGASQVSGLNFTVESIESYQEQARQEAFNDAWNKARSMAKQAGVNIARVVTFSEGGGYGGEFYAAKEMSMDSSIGSGAPSPIIPELSPGQQKISSTVYVTYEIK
jgi:hypothetical protein